jgi:osmotically-inducible protein OsmY
VKDHGANEYVQGEVQHLLAEDPRTAEQGIRVVCTDDEVILVGEVESPDRCEQIEAVVREAFPDLKVRCDVALTRVSAPQEVERI